MQFYENPSTTERVAEWSGFAVSHLWVISWENFSSPLPILHHAKRKTKTIIQVTWYSAFNGGQKWIPRGKCKNESENFSVAVTKVEMIWEYLVTQYLVVLTFKAISIHSPHSQRDGSFHVSSVAIQKSTAILPSLAVFTTFKYMPGWLARGKHSIFSGEADLLRDINIVL